MIKVFLGALFLGSCWITTLAQSTEGQITEGLIAGGAASAYQQSTATPVFYMSHQQRSEVPSKVNLFLPVPDNTSSLPRLNEWKTLGMMIRVGWQSPPSYLSQSNSRSLSFRLLSLARRLLIRKR